MKLYKYITIGTLALLLALGVIVSAAHAEENRGPGMPGGLKAANGDRKEMQGDIKDIRKDFQGQMKDLREENKGKMASSTSMFKQEMKDKKAALQKQMEAKIFEVRKTALVKELKKALSNLDEIVTRIETRMTKAEGEGRNMTEPKALLVTAKAKLAQAKLDVAAFENLTSTSTTSTGTTTLQVDLTKPRQVGDAAIKSVKAAREALQKVVVSIAHNMGKGEEEREHASTTPRGPKPPKTGTSTPPIGTTTPPTTGTTTNH